MANFCNWVIVLVKWRNGRKWELGQEWHVMAIFIKILTLEDKEFCWGLKETDWQNRGWKNCGHLYELDNLDMMLYETTVHHILLRSIYPEAISLSSVARFRPILPTTNQSNPLLINFACFKWHHFITQMHLIFLSATQFSVSNRCIYHLNCAWQPRTTRTEPNTLHTLHIYTRITRKKETP